MNIKNLYKVNIKEVQMEGSQEIMETLAEIQKKILEIEDLCGNLQSMNVEVSFAPLRRGWGKKIGSAVEPADPID